MKRKTRTITVNNNQYIWWCKFYDKKSAIVISPIQDKTSTITVEFMSASHFLNNDDIHSIGNYPEYIVMRKGDNIFRIKTIEPKMVNLMLNQLTDSIFRSRQNFIFNGLDLIVSMGYTIIKIEMGRYW